MCRSGWSEPPPRPPREPRSGVKASTGATGNELKPGEETGGDFLEVAGKEVSIEATWWPRVAEDGGSLVAGDDGAED